MKRIAIFCDGTWNRLAAPNPTHVARLARAVTPSAADGATQLVYYQQGVGTGRGTNGLARKMDKFLGGALGWGLDDNIVEAYRNLVFWYEPGDEIFVFGFSRGAYTARSLAGLIRTAGIPPRAHLPRLQEAVEIYRARGPDTHPDAETCRPRRSIPDRSSSTRQTFRPRLGRGQQRHRGRHPPVRRSWPVGGAGSGAGVPSRSPAAAAAGALAMAATASRQAGSICMTAT